MTDLAAKIHKSMYGKSDKANHADNDNSEFQAGYRHGIESYDLLTLDQIIPAEWVRRNQPEPGDEQWTKFKEWKRGLWAARFQKAMTEAKKEI